VTTRPTASYIICSTPRCGSNLLCEALLRSGVAGWPEEFFAAWARPEAELAVPARQDLDRIFAAGTTPNGVFGCKLMWEHFDRVIERLRGFAVNPAAPPHRVLAAVFPGLAYLHIVRTDKVRQAVSLARAVQSGRWTEETNWAAELPRELLEELARKAGLDLNDEWVQHALRKEMERPTPSPTPASHVPPVYDFDQLAEFHRLILLHEQAWQDFFASAGLAPHRVVYEDLAANYQGVADAALDYLGLPRPNPGAYALRNLKRQSDAINDEWAERLAADLGARAR
jgi:trehalose 2-sulfotransferase